MNLSSNKTNSQTVKQLEDLGKIGMIGRVIFRSFLLLIVSSKALKNVLNQVDLYDQAKVDDHLAYCLAVCCLSSSSIFV